MMQSESKNILEEAMEITSGDRRRDYGHPKENFDNIASMWSAYLRMSKNNVIANVGEITAQDVAMMMMLLKMARNKNTYTRDNIVDICGYARNIEMIEDYE